MQLDHEAMCPDGRTYMILFTKQCKQQRDNVQNFMGNLRTPNPTSVQPLSLRKVSNGVEKGKRSKNEKINKQK